MSVWRRWIDLGVLSAIGVLVGLTFGLPLSSLAQFCTAAESSGGLGSSAQGYAIVTACFAVGQGVGAWLIGALQARLVAGKPTRTHHASFAVSLGVVLLGALVYWAGASMPVIAVARALQGAGSGGLNTLARSFINRSTAKAFVTVVTAATASFVSVFMGVGPAISSAFAHVEPRVVLDVGALTLRIDVFRLPAVFLLAAASAVALCLPLMTDRINVHRPAAVAIAAAPSVNDDADADATQPLLAASLAPPPRPKLPWWRVALSPLASMLTIFTALSAVFASYEAVAAPLLARKYGTTIAELGPVFLWSSLAAAAAFVVVALLLRTRRATGKPTVGPDAILLGILLLAIVALLFLADFGAVAPPERAFVERCAAAGSEMQCTALADQQCVWNGIEPRVCRVRASLDWLSVAALALVNISFVVGRVVSSGQFMTLLHAESSARAASLLLVVGSVARVAAPVGFVALLEQEPVFPALWPFAVSGALMTLVTVHFLVARSQRKRE
jgi:MFS family permease